MQNYKGTNEAKGQLLAPIGASATTLILKTGQGGLFSSVFPFKLKIEKYDSNGNVIKREIVKCTNRTGDSFTIVRSHEYCPADYLVTTQTNTAFSFDADDWVFCVITSDTIDDIQDEILLKLNTSTYNLEKSVFGASSQGSDSYKITSTDITTYNNGQTFKIQADVGNTGSATLELNSLGAKTLKKYMSGILVDLDTGDIITNQIFWATYNQALGVFQFSVDPAQTILPTGITGEIKLWTTNTPPTSWLLADGTAVSRITYSALFTVIGTVYGAGDGSTTFNLPNLKGKIPVGRDSTQTEFDTLGETGGEKTHTLTIAEIPSHSHNIKTQPAFGTGSSYGGPYVGGSNIGTTENSGSGGAHNNLQPYITLNYIIKY